MIFRSNTLFVLTMTAALAGCGGGGSGTGGGGDGDGDASPTSPVGLQLLPLNPGNKWTYAVSDPDYCLTSVDGKVEQTVTGPHEVNGRQVYNLDPMFCFYGHEAYAVSGDQILQLDGNWGVGFESPVQDGLAWETTTFTDYSYRAVPSITVPAGTFEACWERVIDGSWGSTAYQGVYCPGVGLVRAFRNDLVVELLSYSLVGD